MTNRAIAGATALWEKIAGRSTLLTELYGLPYREVVAREIALGEISADDLVLHVGCGAVPFTAIHAARLAGARIWALDRDPAAVRAARACVHRLGLNGQIVVRRGDASVAVPMGFDAAIVALQAEPKENILRILRRAGRRGAGLIFRAAAPRFRAQYDSLPPSFRADAVARQDMRTFDRSILYRVRSRETERGVQHVG